MKLPCYSSSGHWYEWVPTGLHALHVIAGALFLPLPTVNFLISYIGHLGHSYEELFNTAILGFALTEALGLFALMMALIFLYR